MNISFSMPEKVCNGKGDIHGIFLVRLEAGATIIVAQAPNLTNHCLVSSVGGS